jgi:hypothetical protein
MAAFQRSNGSNGDGAEAFETVCACAAAEMKPQRTRRAMVDFRRFIFMAFDSFRYARP